MGGTYKMDMDDPSTDDWRYEGMVYCREFFFRPTAWNVLASSLLILLVIGVALVAQWRILNNRRMFSVRQRAPILGVAQIIYFLTYILLQLIIIGLMASHMVNWYLDEKAPGISGNNVPLSRRIAKMALMVFRTGISYMFIIRTIAIWVQWKKKYISRSKFRWILHVFGTQVRVVWFSILLSIFLGTVGSNFGVQVSLSKPAINWYSPGMIKWYVIHNSTLSKALELMFAMIGLFLMSSFPSSLRIMEEYSVLTASSLCIWWIIETGYRLSPRTTESCFLGVLRLEFCSELLRCLVFSIVLAFYSQRQESLHCPSNRLYDFSDFCRDMKCVQLFRKYLKQKYPQRVSEYDLSLQELYSTAHEYDGSTILRRSMAEFRSYKQTKSYNRLKQQRAIEEEVEAIGYIAQ